MVNMPAGPVGGTQHHPHPHRAGGRDHPRGRRGRGPAGPAQRDPLVGGDPHLTGTAVLRQDHGSERCSGDHRRL